MRSCSAWPSGLRASDGVGEAPAAREPARVRSGEKGSAAVVGAATASAPKLRGTEKPSAAAGAAARGGARRARAALAGAAALEGGSAGGGGGGQLGGGAADCGVAR